jgi:hypothetical protein
VRRREVDLMRATFDTDNLLFGAALLFVISLAIV